MAQISKVAVAGGSGQLGQRIVASLLDDGFETTVLSRRHSGFPPKLQAHITQVDYESPSALTEALRGHDVLICCLSMSSIGIQPALFSAACAAGVKYIIPSEYGVIQHDPKAREQLPMFRPILDFQDILKDFAAKGECSYIIIACGTFLELALSETFVLDWEQKKATVYDDGNHGLSSTRLATIGKAIASILKSPGLYKNGVVRIHETIITKNEWLSMAQNADPSSQWAVTHADSMQVIKKGLAALQEPENEGAAINSAAVMGSILFAASFARDYEETAFKQVENDRLGIAMMSKTEVEELISKRVRGWKPDVVLNP